VEYIIGFIVAIAALFIFRFGILKNIDKDSLPQIKYSQSHIHEIIKNYIPNSFFDPIRQDSQSLNHNATRYTRVVFVENSAYWIKNNTLFVADFHDGMVDEETTRQVDTMGMNEVELKKVISIVDALTEGQKNDRGHTGNQNL
jgi:hypothetical protein